MKILFTGERGQLAHKIAESLDQDSVIRVDPMYKKRCSQHHSWLELDITDGVRLGEIFGKYKPDVVVHSAAVVNTDKCASDPQRSVDVNLMGTHNVIRACRDSGARLLYFSTTATYDPEELRPFTERSRQRPPTMYGITKYAGELLVTGQSDVPHIVVRPCFVYGDAPLDHSSQLCRIAVHEALRKHWPSMAGPRPFVTLDPMALKDYMRIEDFSRAVCDILAFPPEHWRGFVFNVSYQKARPMGEYFEMLRQAMNVTHLNMEWRPAADYMGAHIVDSSKLRACTGWKPEIDVREGVRRTAVAAEKYVLDCREGKDQLFYQ